LDFSLGKVTVCYNGKGIGKLLAAKFQKIDIGIILKYVELALQNEGKTVTGFTPNGKGKSFAVTVTYEEK
jgi:hypothetical protein